MQKRRESRRVAEVTERFGHSAPHPLIFIGKRFNQRLQHFWSFKVGQGVRHCFTDRGLFIIRQPVYQRANSPRVSQ